MIPRTLGSVAITSGKMHTKEASIEMNEAMFEVLSSQIYKNKILAVIREVICNARDTQVESGTESTLQVHLPNTLEPYFEVRDFGTGLSEDQVMDLYLTYGYSTKRTSNDSIGSLGLGSKSPLAYTGSFIVESYYQGKVTTYSVYKEKGFPRISQLCMRATSEENGLKIKVPVNPEDFQGFYANATEFLKYFGYPVEVTGRKIDLTTDVELETDKYTVYKGCGSLTTKVNMGGVIYSVSSILTEPLAACFGFGRIHINLPIGTVSVAASRETLSEDKETIETMKSLVGVILKEHYDNLQSSFDDAKTPYEALRLIKKFSLVRNGYNPRPSIKKAAAHLVYDGELIEELLTKGSKKVRSIRKNYRYEQGDESRSISNHLTIPLFLLKDKATGFTKVAKELSNHNNREWVVLLGEGYVDTVKEFFGNDIEILSTVEKYKEFFPKAAKGVKVKVTNSGVYTRHSQEVTEFDETLEGFYIPFKGSECLLKDTPTNFTWNKLTSLLSCLSEVSEEHKKKCDKILLCRKGGIRYTKKTKLKEMLWEDLKDLIKGSFTDQEYKAYVSRYSSGVNPLILKVKGFTSLTGKYPVTFSYLDLTGVLFKVSNSRTSVLLSLGQNLVTTITNFEQDKQKFEEALVKETKEFYTKYPMLIHIDPSGFTLQKKNAVEGYINLVNKTGE